VRFLDWRTDGRDWPLREHSRFVRSGALTWHVQRLGSGPGILLIHGTGASTHSWRGVAPLLAKGFEILSVDLPGHGFTRGRLASGLRLPGIADALAELLRVEAFTPALAVGHSAGAAIAVQLALAEQLTASILAFAPALRPMGGEAAPFFSGAARLLLANPFTSFLAAGAARHAIDIGAFLKRSTGSQIDRQGVELYARLFRSPGHVEGAIGLMADWDLVEVARRLPNLPVPLSIAHGERDVAVPLSEAREIAHIKGAPLEVLPGLGHLAHEERPDLAAALIEEAVR
jgi:magnesium chelatase accessory protein